MEYDLIAKKYEISVHISRTFVIHNLVIKGYQMDNLLIRK